MLRHTQQRQQLADADAETETEMVEQMDQFVRVRLQGPDKAAVVPGWSGEDRRRQRS